MSKYIKATLSVFGTNIAVVPILMFSGIIIARVLGPEGKGILAIIILIATILKMLGGMGMEFANVYFTSRERDKLPQILLNNILIWIFSVISISIIALILRPWILGNFIKGFNASYYSIGVCIFPFLLWLGYGQTLLQGLEKFKEFNILRVSEPGSRLVWLAIFLLLFHMGVHGGIAALLAGYTFAVCVSILMIKKFVSEKISYNGRLLARSIKYGIKGQVGIFFQFFNYRLDMFFVNYFLDISAVGIYTVSVAIGEILWHIPNSIVLTLFPRVSPKDTPSANEFTSKICRNSLSIMLILALLIGIMGFVFIPLLYGSRFRGAILPLIVLLPGIIALGLVKLLSGHLHGRGKPHFGSIATIVSLVITIVLDIVLIPAYGVVGAALATTCAYITSLIVIIWFFTRESGLKVREYLMPSVEFIHVIRKRISSTEK